ncbi:MAG: hypothetical protein EXS68_00855 [Candidatus Ryanbacteria bacterium]|nr:hypothetical protein [Candidatus Ryanbacteria bacterium]
MLRSFIVVGVVVSCCISAGIAHAGLREVFLQGELKFVDFQNPAPEYTLSADTRTKVKDHFVSIYNRTLAIIVRLEHGAERTERAIGTRELASEAEQLRVKLAYARTRLAEARVALDSIKTDFEKLLISDPHTTLRTRVGRMRARFEKEVAVPIRSAHMTLIGIALKLKETQ